MHLSDLLLKKLNSNAELHKRIQLAKNVFISLDLRISYKEEIILTWFLKMIIEAKNEEEKNHLLSGFCFSVLSDNMTLLPASGIRATAKSSITKHLTDILKNTENLDGSLTDSVFIILKKFYLHYKSHLKQYMKIISALLKQRVTNLQYVHVLNLTSDVFKSAILNEKFLISLLSKNFHVFFYNLDGDSVKDNAVMQFIQKIFFKKETVTEFQILLHEICSGHEINVKSPVLKVLIGSLYNLYVSDFDIDVKTKTFGKVFQSFLKSCGSEESLAVLQLFIVMCHLVGVEQNVCFIQSEGSFKSLINEKNFQESFNVSTSELTEMSYTILNFLIEILSKNAPDLNVNLMESTYLQWFQSLILVAFNSERIFNVHLHFFSACADLNTTIIEKNFIKILTHVLSQPMDVFENKDFTMSLNQFMENMLLMYSKLQRIQKFISKLLLAVRNVKSCVPLKCLISNSFITEFSNMITLFPSMHSLSLMDDLLKTLDCYCVQILEKNSESVNTLLVQVTCVLLSSFLCGVRVLSHTTPQRILNSFVEKIRELKGVLQRFGKALLIRIHDREIVQPFLNLCYYWGEFELLITYYAPDHAEQLTAKDISPTDLSSLHSYLNGEEWNILAERVSNFGAVQCYQYFLKLILQKLRALQFKRPYSSTSSEGTSKYILTLLTSELYKHNIIEELTPDDVNSLLSYLTHRQSRLLLEKLYTQAVEVEEDGKFIYWMRDSVLLENENFITLSFVIILNKFGFKLNNFSKHNDGHDIPFGVLTLEFVDENCNINSDDFMKLVEHVNDLLNDGSGISLDDNAILREFRLLINVVKSLPLVHMSPKVCSFALTGLTFLAVVFSNIEEFLKPLILLMFDLTILCNRTNSCSDLNTGFYIKWLLQLEVNIGQIKNNFVKMLIKHGTYKENGLNDLKQLVNFMKKRKVEEDSRSLEQQLLLYHGLGKSWPKNKRRAEVTEEISKCRNVILKRIRKELEKQMEMETPTIKSDILVTAYSTELISAVKLNKEENIVSLIQFNFEKFFHICVSNLREGTKEEGYISFLIILLTHMPTLKKHLKKDTLKEIWNCLKTCSSIDWKLFYRIANEEEFEFFLLDLLEMWKVFISGENPVIDFETYFAIWQNFYDIDAAKRELYEIYVKHLFVQFSAGVAAMRRFKPNQMVHLFNFLKFCISTAELAMTSSMLDTSFDILFGYDYGEEMSNKEFQNLFESNVGAASWILTARSVRMKDKIHNIFQLFTKLLESLMRRSCVTSDITEDDLLALASCSHNMEKWTSKMIKWSKDFSRVSVYFVAALVSSFVKFSIYPAVKTPLVNCIHNFLSISDSYNIAHLVRVLNPGSQQIFSGIYDTYTKYYRFTGKV